MGKGNKKYIPVVRDRQNGSYAYRGAMSERKTRRNVEKLRNSGVRGRDIDILEVKDPARSTPIALSIFGIIVSVVDIALNIYKLRHGKDSNS